MRDLTLEIGRIWKDDDDIIFYLIQKFRSSGIDTLENRNIINNRILLQVDLWSTVRETP
jgi:hypothetical protein